MILKFTFYYSVYTILLVVIKVQNLSFSPVMAEKKKRKIDYKCRQFQDEWSSKYFFIKSADKALCVICHEAIAVLKEYNLRRHYQTKHQSNYSQLTGKVRAEKFAKLQHQISAQRLMFMKCSNENESLTKLSYKVAYVLAKCGKQFTVQTVE